MATTKKVASARSLQKKVEPKKSASLSNSKIKKTKVTKKKTIVKKTTAKKKVSTPIKKTDNKSTRKTSTKKADIKGEDKTVATVRKTSEKSIFRNKNTTHEEKKSLIVNTTMSLALLNTTRFPLNIDVFAMQTARIGGVMVVMIGAFFTLLYSQYIWKSPIVADSISGQQMLGQVIRCEEYTLNTIKYDNCVSKHLNSLSFQELSSPVPEPPIIFETINSVPLSGVVPVYIKVDTAQTVDVLVFKKSYTNPIPLGSATKLSQGHWVYYWDTTSDEDEFYKLAADVTNVYTTGKPYRDSNGKYLEVLNNPIKLPSVTSVATATIDTVPHVDLHLSSSNPVIGIAKFKINVPDAERITLIAHHKESGSNNSLGGATYVSGDEWKYTWDTTDYIDGSYTVKTKIKNKHGSYIDGLVELTVKNKKIISLDDKLKNNIENNITDTTAISDTVRSLDIPKVLLQILGSGTLSGMVDVQVAIEGARFVELWAIPEGSETRKIIGLAKQVRADSNQWVFQWNTARIPNASYRVVARVKNNFGLYESNVEKVTIYNVPYIPEPTDEQKQNVELIKEAKKIELKITTEGHDDELKKERQQVTTTEAADYKDNQDVVDTFLLQSKKEIDDELHRLIVAYRSGDNDSIERAEARLERLKQEIIANATRDTKSEEITAQIEQRIDEIIAKHKILSKRAEELITQRVGKDIFKDSDSDGISDYDEQTLYKTDPFTADTDGDGFIDGLEVANGYDPLDSKRETTVVYESPREQGIMREDILTVYSIESIIPKNPIDDTDGVDAQAVISGKALPNSFVTLYIFSTPIIVTVKTEEDGSWKYRFDKELEDGEHQVYVGLTDNAGRIVAKSEPFAFVKEAQAFSPVNASTAGTITNEQSKDSLLSTYMVYLILSISVVSIGLVLILLGLHLDTRQRRFKGVINIEEES